MNILFLTRLYPEYENQPVTEMSYALHYFSREWKKNNSLIVLRASFPLYKEIFENKSLYQKLKPSFELDGIKIYNFKLFRFPKISTIFGIFLLKRLLRNNNFYPDLIIGHLLSSSIIAYKLSSYFKCKFVLGIHNGDLYSIKKGSFKKAFLRCSNIACRSFYIKSEFLKYFPEYNDKILIANSGIEASNIENHEYFETKIKNWERKNKIVFITVARLVKRKNIDIVLYALSFLSEYNFEYIIVGDGEEKDNLLKLTDKLNLNDRVFFEGEKKREEIFPVLKRTDVFIMVSERETFGLVYLEAMAKGNIVIGAKNWGIDGIVIDGKNGFLAEAGDIDHMASLIKRIFLLEFNERAALLREIERTILENTTEKAAENYLRSICTEDK